MKLLNLFLFLLTISTGIYANTSNLIPTLNSLNNNLINLKNSINNKQKLPTKTTDLSQYKKEIDKIINDISLNFIFKVEDYITKTSNAPATDVPTLRNYAAEKLIEINLQKPKEPWNRSRADEILEAISEFSYYDFYKNLEKSAIEKMIKELIENGANINNPLELNHTPLTMAVWKGDNQILAEILLDKGANINQEIGYTKDLGQNSSLLKAATNNLNVEMVKLLINKGLKPTKEDEDFAEKKINEETNPEEKHKLEKIIDLLK